MPIRYKVVRNNRKSCVVAEKSKFSLQYKLNHIVKEKIKAAGILCFETKQQAEVFRDNFFCPSNYKIIKVMGIGRGRKLKAVARITVEFERNLNVFSLQQLMQISTTYSDFARRSPEGTISYQTVKVLT